MGKRKIVISHCSGFCFGVERAIKIAEAALGKKKTIYSLGPIIHNPQVVNDLSKRGLKVVKSIRSIREKKPAILIPSHGIDPKILKTKKLLFFDTTCPLVRRVQDIARDLVKKKYFVIIVGKKDHPEARALAAMLGKRQRIVKDGKEAERLAFKEKRIAVISQTTAAITDFKNVLSEIRKKDINELAVFNTVCKDTLKRQDAAKAIAGRVDGMLIVGGRQSSNTAKLAEVCKKVNVDTKHIESFRELPLGFLTNKKKIGIATGASTPPYAVKEVVRKIRRSEK